MINRMMSRLTLVTFLGAALTGASLLNVRADDSSWKDDADNFAEIDPAPVSYPMAAPGALNLYHWKDYTETSLKSGSVSEARYWRQAKLDKQRMDRMKSYDSDEQRMMMHRNKGEESGSWSTWDMYDPSPVGYPEAAPGGLHLYHWTDYSRTVMSPGSAHEARRTQMEKMEMERRKANKEMMSRDPRAASDWNTNLDASPVGYPMAAPGSLNLYHWTDYSQTVIAPGSAEDAREMNRYKMEKMRREQMKQMNQNSDSK